MNTPEDTTPKAPKPEPKFEYEVLAHELKIGGVIAYRTARVKLTKAQADALNSAQPDSVKFLGI